MNLARPKVPSVSPILKVTRSHAVSPQARTRIHLKRKSALKPKPVFNKGQKALLPQPSVLAPTPAVAASLPPAAGSEPLVFQTPGTSAHDVSAEALPNGLFIMSPSGDLVDRRERDRRLAK